MPGESRLTGNEDSERVCTRLHQVTLPITRFSRALPGDKRREAGINSASACSQLSASLLTLPQEAPETGGSEPVSVWALDPVFFLAPSKIPRTIRQLAHRQGEFLGLPTAVGFARSFA